MILGDCKVSQSIWYSQISQANQWWVILNSPTILLYLINYRILCTDSNQMSINKPPLLILNKFHSLRANMLHRNFFASHPISPVTFRHLCILTIKLKFYKSTMGTDDRHHQWSSALHIVMIGKWMDIYFTPKHFLRRSSESAAASTISGGKPISC